MIMKMLQQLLKWDLYFIKNGNAPPLPNSRAELIFGATCGRVKFLNNCVNLPQNNANFFTISPSKS